MESPRSIARRLHAFAWFQLLEGMRVRLRWHVRLRLAAALLAFAVAAALATGLLAAASPNAAWALLAACLALAAAFAFWGFFHAARASTHAAAARALAEHLPHFGLHFLCAWELACPAHSAHASPALVRAFWENLDTRVHHQGPLKAPPLPLPRAYFLGTAAALALCGFLGVHFAATWKTGLLHMRGAFAAHPLAPLEPIAGEFEVHYVFPAYTGLEALTVHNSTGEINALYGTTVHWKAKADRNIEQAQLLVNGQPLPVEVQSNRMLHASWVATAGGSYQMEFLRGGRRLALSPPLPLHVALDNPPTVRLLAPQSPLGLAPDEDNLLLRFEAQDDYGLHALELHYAVDEQAPATLPLPAPTTRALQGEFLWALGPLALLPGQTVSYWLVARDNDVEAGHKEGASQTHIFQTFSQAVHQTIALDKTQQAWKQLLAHAAYRIESRELFPRAAPSPQGSMLDEQAKEVAAALEQTASAILEDAHAPQALADAFSNAANTLRRMADNTAKARAQTATTHNPELLSKAVSAETASTEHNLLYLEALLAQFRAQALAEFAGLLKTQLAQLKALLSQHAHATQPEEKAALLAQIEQRKASVLQLLERVAHMSASHESGEEVAVEWSQNFQAEAHNALGFLETALADGRVDEALQHADALLQQLDDTHAHNAPGAEQAQANAALLEEFENFRHALDAVLAEQEALLQQTQALFQQQNEQTAREMAHKTNALRPEMQGELQTLQEKLKNLNLERMTAYEHNMREEALKNIDMLKSALEAQEPSLASDIARELVQKTEALAEAGKTQAALDVALGNSPEERQRSKQTQEASLEGAGKAREFEERLRSLFGRKSGLSADADTTSSAAPVAQQEALGKRTREVQRQMHTLADKAPLFSEEAKEHMEQVARHMEQAAARLRLGNPQEGQSEQAQASQTLKALKQQLQAGGAQRASLPMPSGSGKLGQGWAHNPSRLEIPRERASLKPFLRTELLETMRQGVPEGYAEPVRRYYEELVK